MSLSNGVLRTAGLEGATRSLPVAAHLLEATLFARANLQVRSESRSKKSDFLLPAGAGLTRGGFPKRPVLRAKTVSSVQVWRALYARPAMLIDNRTADVRNWGFLILDCGFQVPSSGFQVPGSALMPLAE